MTNQSAASLAYRLLGIYVLTECLAVLGGIPSLYSIFSSVPAEGVTILLAMAGILLFIVVLGVLLVFKSGTLARLTVSPDQEQEEASRPKGDPQAIAFSVLGVYLVAAAFPGLSMIVAQCLLGGPGPAYPNPVTRLWPTLLQYSIQVVVGVALFLQSKGLVRLWEKFQQTLQRIGPS